MFCDKVKSFRFHGLNLKSGWQYKSCQHIKIKNENELLDNKQIATILPTENKIHQNQFVKVFTFTLVAIY